MSEYDGLNLVELLDLLHDIVRPEPVSWMPQTVGWAVVAAWLTTVTVLVARNRYRRWRDNRYRREALSMLRSIEADVEGDSVAAAGRIATLLKRTALAAYPRADIAALYGADWAQFLSTSAGNDAEVEAAVVRLSMAAYRADDDVSTLIEPARRWIRMHRA